ncbi:MAG: hypothetical protein ACRDBG_06520 [Waterburya sp.]
MNNKRSIGRGSLNMNDCAVQAFANCLDLSYNDSLNLCQSVGWTPESGCPVNGVVELVTTDITGRRFDCILFGNSRCAQYAETLREFKKQEGLSLLTFQNLSVVKNRRIIVWTRGHVFAMIDGEILDEHSASLDSRVIGAFFLLGEI